jgi:transcriptional regulator GlxA family with amidase domain
MAKQTKVADSASRVFKRLNSSEPEAFAVSTISRAGGAIRARAGLNVSADHSIIRHPKIDLLIIPGGVVTQELARTDVLDCIASASHFSRITASVCTGAFLLANAGLLDGKCATTHWEDIDDLKSMFPQVNVIKERRWVDEGTIVNSAGIAAGIDMSLHLVERFRGRDLALRTARQMEFDWKENS